MNKEKIKKFIKYYISSYEREKCRISYLYSCVVDLDKGIPFGTRKFKEHKKEYIKSIK